MTPQAAAKELEEVMKRVREAQSFISAAIEPGRLFLALYFHWANSGHVHLVEHFFFLLGNRERLSWAEFLDGLSNFDEWLSIL